MRFSESLKKNNEFQKVYKNGVSYANKYLVMYVLENKLSGNRLGISVSKKVGNSIVRHRLKRLVKENYRLQEEMFNSGLDIVIVIRVNAKDCDFKLIRDAIIHLGNLHKITIKNN